ncbi:MAB_1171c family putative transporter [Streptomyces sp. NPDC046985]|uniref:MAB_1171c family putative transporter n=1 Tax=Streptomyces sp. NPDC046985 TaxID=3155377 RepID=UPI0033E1F992
MSHLRIPYLIPTVLLAVALVLKGPTVVRAWRDPDVRATTLLLTWATAVMVVITPINIERLNAWSKIPNLSAPWAYSFLTAFCATALTMIMRWREEPSERRRRRMIRIYWIYGGIIAGLWATFFLADASEIRIYDLDTYYANTPWMREHILLYLVAHMVSGLVAVSMLRQWSPEVTHRWLKAGVVCLQVGFGSGLFFDAAKLVAVVARWTGHDLDVLSTNAAPPFAMMEGIMVACGFIVPQAGPIVQRWGRDRRDFWCLRPLWRALRVTKASAATARFGLWTPLSLRLMQRQQRIHDALRLLGPYFDQDLYRRAYTSAALGHAEDRARGIAGALALQAAVSAYETNTLTTTGDQTTPGGGEVAAHIDAVARALHRPRLLERVHRQMTRPESAAHA